MMIMNSEDNYDFLNNQIMEVVFMFFKKNKNNVTYAKQEGGKIIQMKKMEL